MIYIFLILYLVYNIHAYELKNKVLSYIEKKTITLLEFNSRIKFEETIKKINMTKFQKSQILKLLIEESIIKEFFKKNTLYFKKNEIYIKTFIKTYINKEKGVIVFKDLEKSDLIKYIKINMLAKKIIRDSENKKKKLKSKFFSTIIVYKIYYQNNFFMQNKKKYILTILSKKNRN